MDWDQIESKWAAMTRRVRGDLSVEAVNVAGKSSRGMSKADANTTIVADLQGMTDTDQQASMPTP